MWCGRRSDGDEFIWHIVKRLRYWLIDFLNLAHLKFLLALSRNGSTAARGRDPSSVRRKQINIQKQYIFPNKFSSCHVYSWHQKNRKKKFSLLSFDVSYNLFVNNFGDIWWFFGWGKLSFLLSEKRFLIFYVHFLLCFFLLFSAVICFSFEHTKLKIYCVFVPFGGY